MVYTIFVLVAALSTIAVCCFAGWKGALDPGPKLKIYKQASEDVIPFSGAGLMVIVVLCFVLCVVLQISLYQNTEIVSFIKLFGLFLIVTSAAIVDQKRKIIPNELIITGLIFRIGLYIYEISSHADIKSILINDLIGLAVGFGILAIASLVTRGSVGLGDAKLFGVIGIISGSFCTYSTLLLSLIISSVVSIIGIARKKIGRKDAIPFGPSIAIGYTIALLLTSY